MISIRRKLYCKYISFHHFWLSKVIHSLLSKTNNYLWEGYKNEKVQNNIECLKGFESIRVCQNTFELSHF